MSRPIVLKWEPFRPTPLGQPPLVHDMYGGRVRGILDFSFESLAQSVTVLERGIWTFSF